MCGSVMPVDIDDQLVGPDGFVAYQKQKFYDAGT
jgi:hypothetical protein